MRPRTVSEEEGTRGPEEGLRTKEINSKTKKGTGTFQTANVETGLHLQYDNGQYSILHLLSHFYRQLLCFPWLLFYSTV